MSMPRKFNSKPIIAIAPMMQYTDRHFRYFMRLISKHIMLYTEMVTTGAILFGNKHRFLQFDPCEHPIAIQLGGNEPNALAQAAKIACDYGYDEINLNVGCPSDRVQSGQFGACLMAKPQLVAECVDAMKQVVSVPVTVKTRIGIDDKDNYEFLQAFVRIVASAGCNTFIIHARKAWLNGLSPKQNREIPPLRYDVVKQLKQDFSNLMIIINGGIRTFEAIQSHLAYVDGVMLGRVAYETPYLLSGIDQQFFNEEKKPLSRLELIKQFLPYLEKEMAQGTPFYSMVRHCLGLFQGVSGGRSWRRFLSESASLKQGQIALLEHRLTEFLA